MIIGIATRNPRSWTSIQLIKAIRKYGLKAACINLSRVIVGINCKFKVMYRGVDLAEKLSSLIVRPLGVTSPEKTFSRLNALHKLHNSGVKVVNSPNAIEKCIDKFATLLILERNGIPVPETIVVENINEALNAFNELGGDVVIKPIFGSRGYGIIRVNDFDIAFRVFKTLNAIGNVIYIQKFIPHKNRDIRAFIIGGEVVSSMIRQSNTWKTNIAQGAKPKYVKLNRELTELAIKAAEVTGCEIAGIDIIENNNGKYYITEVNSMPNWQGLQSVTPFNIAEKIIKYVLSEIKK